MAGHEGAAPLKRKGGDRNGEAIDNRCALVFVIGGGLMDVGDPRQADAQSPVVQTEVSFLTLKESGAVRDLRPGTLLETGIPKADGSCSSRGFSVSVRARGAYSAVIKGSIDEFCNVWVDETSWSQTTSEDIATYQGSKSSGTGNFWYGFTKTELNDFVGLDLATAFADLAYIDDGSSLSNGVAWHDCDAFAPTGWSIVECREYDNETSSTHMYSRTYAEIANAFWNTDTYADARFDAYPGDGDHDCDYGPRPRPRGLPDPVWRCHVGHFQV